MPHSLKGILEDVQGGQGLIGRQQLLALHRLLALEVFPVAQLQPAAVFDHLAGRLAMAQRMGLIDPDALNHTP